MRIHEACQEVPILSEDKLSNAKKQKDPLFKNWTLGDSKLLIIAIAATVAANIINVILVALAVIIARSTKQKLNYWTQGRLFDAYLR